eukprot:Gb_39858 [translate_table: standard]
MASSSTAFCSPIYSSSCFLANSLRYSCCNPATLPLLKNQCLKQEYSLHLHSQRKKKKQCHNVRSSMAQHFRLPVASGDISLPAPWPSPSTSWDQDYNSIKAAKKGNPPIMPAIMTPGGPLDLSSILLRSRIIFVGQAVNAQVAQRVISQLVTLATIDEDADILMYINCPGGSTYSVLAVYDCMSWIKPKVGTVCFGVAVSQGALLLAGGEKGMRYAMPNSRIMIHQPQGGCGGTMEDVRRQVNEVVASRDKLDKMYAAFTGQPLEKVQTYTDRDRFFSTAEALEFGLIDGVLETEY